MDLDKCLAGLTLDDNATKAPPFLDVRSYGNTASTDLCFHEHKLLGTFGISGSLEYVDNSDDSLKHAKLIPESRFRSLIGKNLGKDFNIAKKQKNYKAYSELKARYFMKWLLVNKYFEKVEQKKYKKPDFVCFGGRITDSMKTPGAIRFGDWAIYGVRFNDVVYLYEIKDESRQTDLSSYYGVYFEHILTHENPESKVPDEIEKNFTVQETKFGSHQLICLNEIDAVDDNGEFVEIKVFKRCSPKGMSSKHLGYWAQSIVPGVKKMVVGERNDMGNLINIETISLTSLAKRNAREWTPEACFDFEHRLLTWIKSQFFKNDLEIVKCFSFKAGNSQVTVKDVAKENLTLVEEIKLLL